MSKYIVKVTHKHTQELVVDAGSAEEAKKRGIEKLRMQNSSSTGGAK